VPSEWYARLDQVERGSLESEEALFRHAERHIDPADHKTSVSNMRVMVQYVAAWLRAHQLPNLARVATDCDFSLEARNATHPQKIAGKNNFSAALLLVTRSLTDLRLEMPGLVLSAEDQEVQQLYVRLIAGQHLPVMPAWALDKHTGRGPEKPNESFVVAEQQALQPRSPTPDQYYARAFELSKLKDQKLFAEQEQKRLQASRKRRAESAHPHDEKKGKQ
jgi:hypothetical protein